MRRAANAAHARPRLDVARVPLACSSRSNAVPRAAHPRALALGGGEKVQLAKDGHVPRAPIMAGRRADARQKNRLRAECRRESRRLAGSRERGCRSASGFARVADSQSRSHRDVALRLRSIRERGIIWIVGALFAGSRRGRLVVIDHGKLPRVLDVSIRNDRGSLRGGGARK